MAQMLKPVYYEVFVLMNLSGQSQQRLHKFKVFADAELSKPNGDKARFSSLVNKQFVVCGES